MAKILVPIANGFEEIEIQYLSCVSQEERLKEIYPSMDEIPKEMRKIFQEYNQNIRKINTILFGPQDYAIIGKKSPYFPQ